MSETAIVITVPIVLFIVVFTSKMLMTYAEDGPRNRKKRGSSLDI